MKFLSPHSKQSYSVNYLYDKELKDQGKGNIESIYKNIDNESAKEWISTTMQYCTQRENVQKIKRDLDWNKNTMQIVISIHPGDNDKMQNAWEEVVDKTLQELGIDKVENNVAAWIHKDKDHHHVHVLFSKINYKGDKWDDSKIGYRLNDYARKLSDEFDLNYKDKSRDNSSKSWTPAKHELSNKLYIAYSKSNSFEDFAKELKTLGIKTKLNQNNTLSYSIDFNGKNYVFPESKLSQRYRFQNISKLDRKKEYSNDFESQKKYIKNSISKVLNQSKNIHQFEKLLLEKYQIELIKHENAKGVYGFSFRQKNQQESHTIKGSEVGFSKSKIEYYLSKNSTKETKENLSENNQEKQMEKIDDYIGQMGSLNSSSDDITEDEYRRRRLRQRKKDRGR